MEHRPPSRSSSPDEESLWVDDQLGVAQHSARFWLPVDLKLLETMTPQEYLLKHCKVSPMKWALCQRVFFRFKDKTGVILYKDVKRALLEVLVTPMSPEQLESLYATLLITERTHIDSPYFTVITAFTERFAQSRPEDTEKERVETADFEGLEWKLKGINVSPAVEKILKVLSK